ncbi:hypothetical protein Tco_0161464 [Tanacetum coccineum]
MSSMKNLDDAYNFGDQFLYDKPTEDDQEKSKVIEESDSPYLIKFYFKKYSVLPGPESIKNQESEKSPKEIIIIKREQGEEKQDSTSSIRPLMEALIADEDAMDKEVAVKDEGHVSDLEDTDNAHIPKVSTTTWFKQIPEGERPATPEPEWTIPPNDFPEPENNWANTYATTYQVPAENKLQRKTCDIGSFIKWFSRQTRKKKLCKADLEGPAFNLVKAFHKNSVFLQYQMDECHKLLTNKVDLVNPEGHQIL